MSTGVQSRQTRQDFDDLQALPIEGACHDPPMESQIRALKIDRDRFRVSR
jgi:hypothetical protein